MSNPLNTCPTCKGLGDIRVGRSSNSIKVESCPTCHGTVQILETGKPDTWRNEGVGKWFHNKCGQSHLMDKPCHPDPVQAKPVTDPADLIQEQIEDIIYCGTGCGSQADPADGFGYCTCGAEKQRAAIKTLLAQAKEAGKREGAIAELNDQENNHV